MMNLIERAQRKIPSFGLYITMPDPQIIEMAVAAGYDFARLDAEHISFPPQILAEMFRTARLLDFPLQIRLGSLENLDPVLAMEPAAVMAADIRSGEDAARLARSTKFAPLGRRGMYAFTDAIRFGGLERKEYMKHANTAILTIAQIESCEGMENLEEILQTPGIDMVSSGKADLSQDLGIPGQTADLRVIGAEERIIKAALRHGKVPTLFAESPERIQALYEMGVCCFMVGFDSDLFMKALRERARACTERRT